MDQRGCADLPPDVLREISGRLRHVVDFVRFHAVCRTWRDSHDTKTMRQPSLLPWLLSTNMDKCDVKLRCVFSRTSYHSSAPADERTWVASADGTAVWYLTDGPCPSLHDPLTGAAVAHLPALPDKWEKGQASWGLSCCIFGTTFGLCGIVYSDGVIFLYGLHDADTDDRPTFRAALLRPGDTTWTIVERSSKYTRHFLAAYHRGKIIVIDEANLSHIVMPGDDIGFNDVSVPWPSMLSESDKYNYEYGYALETRGELLWVSVHIAKDYKHRRSKVVGLLRALSISVHVLENDVASGNMRWVGKDKRSLADRVLFLGKPNSFAVDASHFGGEVVSGGCAYFVDYDDWRFTPGYVLRYSLIDDKVKFVEQLPQGWDDPTWMWHFPDPTIARIKENSAMLEGAKWWWKKQHQIAPTPRSIINIERPKQQHYKSYLEVYVCNPPCTVDSSQLRQFFSKYGKVFDAKVTRKRNAKIPKLFGHVSIMMVEKLVDGLAVLDGLVFYGCILEVCLIKNMRQLD